MKSFIVFALCVATALAASTYNGDEKQATIIRSDFDNIGVGPFAYEEETSNGIVETRTGNLEKTGTDEEALVLRGQFSYPGPDGATYSVSYTADKTGYHPEGAHLPK